MKSKDVAAVTFFGSEKSLLSWKKVVEALCNKKCERVVADKYGYRFIAMIDEPDCEKLMAKWYEVELGQDSPWNWRITFRKSYK